MPSSLGEHDVMVAGKRKPFLNSTTQAERVAKYERRTPNSLRLSGRTGP